MDGWMRMFRTDQEAMLGEDAKKRNLLPCMEIQQCSQCCQVILIRCMRCSVTSGVGGSGWGQFGCRECAGRCEASAVKFSTALVGLLEWCLFWHLIDIDGMGWYWQYKNFPQKNTNWWFHLVTDWEPNVQNHFFHSHQEDERIFLIFAGKVF